MLPRFIFTSLVPVPNLKAASTLIYVYFKAFVVRVQEGKERKKATKQNRLIS